MDLDDLVHSSPRFRIEAYLLVNEALGRAQRIVGRRGHVTGPELCEGLRQLAAERYGRMASAVLKSWGLRTTDDVGRVVYDLIAAGMMSKTAEDSIADFHAVFDFTRAFTEDYDFPSRLPDGARDDAGNSGVASH
jgi:uncharacterized repeat protein (TIGR04138 family)